MAFRDCFRRAYPHNPRPADLIEVFRPGYQHWALYLGDGYVINIAPVDGIASALSSAKSVFSTKALVKMQLLKDVVGEDKYRVNNKYDTTYPPLPVEEVILRSEFVIGQEVAYDLLVNNCEHFVTLLRYGEGVSEQDFLRRLGTAHGQLSTPTSIVNADGAPPMPTGQSDGGNSSIDIPSPQANRAVSTIGFVAAAIDIFTFLGLFPKRQRTKY